MHIDAASRTVAFCQELVRLNTLSGQEGAVAEAVSAR